MKRFKTLSASKFTTLIDKDMQSIVGGFLCISCKKKNKASELGHIVKRPIPGDPNAIH